LPWSASKPFSNDSICLGCLTYNYRDIDTYHPKGKSALLSVTIFKIDVTKQVCFGSSSDVELTHTGIEELENYVASKLDIGIESRTSRMEDYNSNSDAAEGSSDEEEPLM